MSPIDYDAASFEPPIYYGYRAGFFPRSRWLAGVLDQFSLTHGVNLVLLNIVGRYPAAALKSRFTLTGRIGLGGSLPHAESRAGGDSRERYEWVVLPFRAPWAPSFALSARFVCLASTS